MKSCVKIKNGSGRLILGEDEEKELEGFVKGGEGDEFKGGGRRQEGGGE